MATKKTAKERLGPHPDIQADGLVWIPRAHGYTPYWRPPTWYLDDKGERRPHVPLAYVADMPDEIIKRCQSLQAEALAWKAGVRGHVGSFDGTFGQIIKKYLTHEDSPFHALSPGSRHPYEFYTKKLEYELGELRVDDVSGIDLKRWHERWSDGGKKLAASKMMRAVLDTAIAFTIMSSKAGTREFRAAAELREILKVANRKLPSPKRRESILTADQVVRLRAAAHADGRPSSALVYALVFETTLRLWDVIGQWVPIDAPGISDVVRPRMKKKWFGLRWEDINEEMVLRYTPSKTSIKTGIGITFPLDRAPMVMEELAHWPAEKRVGPAIIYEGTGEPYGSNYFGEKWVIDKAAVGLPKNIWARDLRASGITEARAAGISTDDAAKVAGHTSTKTTAAVYDRANLEAAERFADARTEKRRKG